jgi:hypothetical protein
MFGQEGEEVPQEFGTAESSALKNSVDLMAHLDGGHGAIMHVSPHFSASNWAIIR